MIFGNLLDNIGKRAEVAKFEIKAQSPEILIGVGIAGMVASTVLACRATLKADDILEQRKENIKKCETLVQDETVPEYTEEDLKNDKRIINVHTGLKVVGLYLPAVTVGILGASCFVKSNGIHREREASMAAAYASLDQLFKRYREKAIEQYGEDADKKLRYDIRTEKIKNEEGKKEEVNIAGDLPDDDYSEFFDESSPYWEKNRHYNQTFLLNEQARWNKVIKDRASINFHGVGYVTLVEVYRDLGISLSPAKMKRWNDIGWVLDLNDPYYDPRSQFISFGICDEILRPKRPGTPNCVDVMPGFDPVFIISPNVQGNIYTLMS